jgi:hypothetical protein
LEFPVVMPAWPDELVLLVSATKAPELAPEVDEIATLPPGWAAETESPAMSWIDPPSCAPEIPAINATAAVEDPEPETPPSIVTEPLLADTLSEVPRFMLPLRSRDPAACRER